MGTNKKTIKTPAVMNLLSRGPEAGRPMRDVVSDSDTAAREQIEYEVSLLPVPAQPGAGIVKSKRYGPDEPGEGGGEEAAPQKDVQALQRTKALLELENIRYGGNQDEV